MDTKDLGPKTVGFTNMPERALAVCRLVDPCTVTGKGSVDGMAPRCDNVSRNWLRVVQDVMRVKTKGNSGGENLQATYAV